MILKKWKAVLSEVLSQIDIFFSNQDIFKHFFLTLSSFTNSSTSPLCRGKPTRWCLFYIPVSKPQLGRGKKHGDKLSLFSLEPPHNAQRDTLAAWYRLTKCWIYESINEYFEEGGFTSCCGDWKCFCLAFVQTRWHWIFMICPKLQRVVQLCTKHNNIF